MNGVYFVGQNETNYTAIMGDGAQVFILLY